jgi:hypothetical protein
MRILLDKSPNVIAEWSERYDFEFWQLRTPLTGYRLAGVPYGLDNGAFSRFDRDAWLRLVSEARVHRPLFVCAPDVVGDARRTMEVFNHYRHMLSGLPVALVLQDGIGNIPIPWSQIDAVFIGGSDGFKVSSEAHAAARAAKMLDKWVHVGRVNTSARVRQWLGVADSIDGSGISQYDHMIRDVLQAIRGDNPQEVLL